MKNAQRLAVATVLLTLVLIAIGAYVRATGSGLGCPDWPTCHGGVVPPNSRHSLIEFSHRFTASLVGLLVIATAVLAWRYYRHVPLVVWAATAAVPMVGIQGLLGALTVKTELPPEVVATHLLFAMVVLSTEIAVALGMYREDPTRRDQALANPIASGRQVALVSLAAIAWLAAVLWIGGYMSESGASTACSGWPTCNGGILPANNHQEIVHMVHRYLAGAFLVLMAAVVVVAWRRRSELPWAAPVAVTAAVLYVGQVTIGAFNVWYTFPDLLTVAHTAVAGCIWATLSTAAFLGWYQPVTDASVTALRPARVTP
jgi:heme A synthase